MRTLSESAIWSSVSVPQPGESIRAGGGVGTPTQIDGYNGDANGGLIITPLVAGLRIKTALGGATTCAHAGTDITVTLASALGVQTATANDAKAVMDADAGALIGTAVTGTGAGLAGGPTIWIPLGTGTQGSILSMEQALTNRTAFLRELSGAHQLPRHVACMDGAVLSIQGLGGQGPRSLDGSATFGPAGLAANTWYYVYQTGPSTFEASTTAPVAALSYKTGDTTRRYVCSFRTNGGAGIIPFSASGGRYLWHTPIVVNAHLDSHVAASVSLAASVPPTSRMAHLYLTLTGGGAAITVYLLPTGSGGTGRTWQQGAGGVARTEVLMGTDSSQRVDYVCTNGVAGDSDLGITTLGYQE